MAEKYELIIKHFGISNEIFEQFLELGEKNWGGKNLFMQNNLLS